MWLCRYSLDVLISWTNDNSWRKVSRGLRGASAAKTKEEVAAVLTTTFCLFAALHGAWWIDCAPPNEL